MRSLFTLLATIFIAAACNTKTASVTSGSINAEAPFLWETSFPKNIYVSNAYSTQAEQDKIDEMLDQWETSLNNYNFFNNVGQINEQFNVTHGSMPNLRDNDFVIYKATRWPFPKYPDALAITQIFAYRHNIGSSNEFVSILEADILMNYEIFNFDTGGFDYDFRTVLLHELGHFLGLQHKPRSFNRNNTVMYPFIDSEEVKQTPRTVDINDLASKYSITLPLTAGGSAISSDKKVYKKNPGDIGEPVMIILELKANGECVHHMDGVIVSRHHMEK